MFALLKVAFAHHDRSDALIRAYEAGCAVHNSPQKPFGSCGYELIRVLALEFSLRTRTEAICLRSELLRKDFKVDSIEHSCCFGLGPYDSGSNQQL